ncbi:preprotein translocase subunit SecE [bacterium]|nr:preprotein translocase subunit SecE [bacterium]
MAAEKASSQESGAKPSLSDALKHYYSTLQYEWKKITFPNRTQLLQSVLVVFIFCIFLMLIVSAYDLVVGWVFRSLILPSTPTGQ